MLLEAEADRSICSRNLTCWRGEIHPKSNGSFDAHCHGLGFYSANTNTGVGFFSSFLIHAGFHFNLIQNALESAAHFSSNTFLAPPCAFNSLKSSCSGLPEPVGLLGCPSPRWLQARDKADPALPLAAEVFGSAFSSARRQRIPPARPLGTLQDNSCLLRITQVSCTATSHFFLLGQTERCLNSLWEETGSPQEPPRLFPLGLGARSDPAVPKPRSLCPAHPGHSAPGSQADQLCVPSAATRRRWEMKSEIHPKLS